MSSFRAAVIIPHYRDEVRLRRCLEALDPQIGPDVEVVVVDNNSGLDFAGWRDRFPKVRFIVETEKGAACARNRGVRETSAEVLCFIDADCVPDPAWLKTAIEIASGCDLTGGRIDTFDEGEGPRTGAQAFETVFAFQQRLYVEKKQFSVTANLVASRKIFLDVGDLRPGVSEDLEWCRRAIAKGYRIAYCDHLLVSHPTRSNWTALKKKWARLTEESFALGGTGPLGRLVWGLKAPVVALSALPHSARVLSSERLNGASERARAIATLFRIRLLRAGWMIGQAASGRPQVVS
jgi:GT2 family glycosyltransferase